MRQVIIAFVISLLFICEYSVVPILLPDGFQQIYNVNPHLTLIAIVMVSLYLGTKVGLIYGLIFGALFDLSSASIIGLYLFSYGLIGNLPGYMLRLLHRNIWLVLTSVGLASIFLDMVHFGLFRLFAYTSQDWSYVMIHQIIPSSLMNIFLALLLYPILHKLLAPLKIEYEEQEGRSTP